MNVAIIGKSTINGILSGMLAESGLTPVQIENIDEITGLRGEKHEFTILSSDRSISAGYVIITDEPRNGLCFENTAAAASKGTPVVFILDALEESPAYFTAPALENAIRHARQKKPVFFLSRFVRTAGSHMESLYKEARNAGVIFVKYNEISVEQDENSGMFQVKASDGYDNIKLETPVVLTEANTIKNTIQENGLERIAGIFRLKRDEGGIANADKSFLFPALTSREGIYFVSQTSCIDKGEEINQLRFIIEDIKNSKTEDINCNYAKIDSAKCAFCYTCYRACPHSAMIPDELNSIMKNLKNSCQACGICVSVCPADAVRLAEKGQMQGARPQSGNSTKTLKILCCENSGEIASKRLSRELSDLYEKIEIMPVSCGGGISEEIILQALTIHDKVLVLVCIDDACKHFDGNKRSERHVRKAREMLKASGLDESRVECLKISHAMPYVLRDQLLEMM